MIGATKFESWLAIRLASSSMWACMLAASITGRGSFIAALEAIAGP